MLGSILVWSVSAWSHWALNRSQVTFKQDSHRHSPPKLKAKYHLNHLIPVWIGTSGYSYQDWKGVFYPADMKDSDFLRFYSERFACVEIDSTYYRIPSPFMFEAISKKVPEGFRFTVKVPSTFTHERERFDETIDPFRKSIEPIVVQRTLFGKPLVYWTRTTHQ